MCDEILNLDALAGHPDQMENGEAVGQASHDAVDRGKLSNAVGRGEDRRAADAGIAVSRIGGIQFVRAYDPLEAGNLLRSIIDGECIVSRNAENPIDSELR